MHNSNMVITVCYRVSILITHFAMGSPPDMAYTYVPLYISHGRTCYDITKTATPFTNYQLIRQYGNTSTIVTTVLHGHHGVK
jgi:hypothetical protein